MSDRDPSEAYDEDDPLVLPARLRKYQRFTPWWSRLLSPLQTFVALLPSHKTTRAGRRAARHFKFAAVAAAGAMLIFGGSIPWIVVGAAILLLVPFLPLPEVRKRAWTNSLKALRQPRKKTRSRPGRILYDGRRVILDKGGSTIRRVLTDRGEHRYRLGRLDGTLYLKLEPSSGKNADSIWVGTDEIDPDEIDEPLESFPESALDRPCLVGGEQWRALLGLLRDIDGDRP